MDKSFTRKTVKDFNFIATAFQAFFALFVVWPVAKLQYNLKIEGRENVKKGKQYIFCPNHVSYLDPPLTVIAVNKRISYMAKQELFYDKNRILRWLVPHLGAFAVNREKPELSTFKTIKDVFKAKWSLGIFPEGRINSDYKLSSTHKGFATIAKQFKIDIIPVAIRGFDGYAGKKLFSKNLSIKIGEAISHELTIEEIIDEWENFMCENAGYQKVPANEELPV